MRILFFGDLIGKPGRSGIGRVLAELIGRYRVELVGANVENAAGGFGLTRDVYNQLLEMGIDFMTSGNHIWDKKDLIPMIKDLDRLLRPANFPDQAPGTGLLLLQAREAPVAVLNLSGRVFMDPLESPFRVVDEMIEQLPKEIKVVLVDFHAEATSEKVAMGWYLDGRVSALLGTHTQSRPRTSASCPKAPPISRMWECADP